MTIVQLQLCLNKFLEENPDKKDDPVFIIECLQKYQGTTDIVASQLHENNINFIKDMSLENCFVNSQFNKGLVIGHIPITE